MPYTLAYILVSRGLINDSRRKIPIVRHLAPAKALVWLQRRVEAERPYNLPNIQPSNVLRNRAIPFRPAAMQKRTDYIGRQF